MSKNKRHNPQWKPAFSGTFRAWSDYVFNGMEIWRKGKCFCIVTHGTKKRYRREKRRANKNEKNE